MANDPNEKTLLNMIERLRRECRWSGRDAVLISGQMLEEMYELIVEQNDKMLRMMLRTAGIEEPSNKRKEGDAV